MDWLLIRDIAMMLWPIWLLPLILYAVALDHPALSRAPGSVAGFFKRAYRRRWPRQFTSADIDWGALKAAVPDTAAKKIRESVLVDLAQFPPPAPPKPKTLPPAERTKLNWDEVYGAFPPGHMLPAAAPVGVALEPPELCGTKLYLAPNLYAGGRWSNTVATGFTGTIWQGDTTTQPPARPAGVV